MADTKASKTEEKELSMDEILSSIRSIITEDQETKTDEKRTFSEDSSTNPSGARQINDIPKFDGDDDFKLSNFYEDEKEKSVGIRPEVKNTPVFPDEDFKQHFSNETSMREQQPPYFNQQEFSRSAHVEPGVKDNISSALQGIVASYAQRAAGASSPEASKPDHGLSAAGSSKLNEMINTMIEKIVVVRIEEWLHKNLSGILEKAILRELERVLTQMKL